MDIMKKHVADLMKSSVQHSLVDKLRFLGYQVEINDVDSLQIMLRVREEKNRDPNISYPWGPRYFRIKVSEQL